MNAFLLHSWNEWCEGTYLEPDAKHGRFFLEETREAVETAQEAITSANLMPTAHVAAQLLRLQRAKDSGAFRVMQSTRMQLHHTWQNLVAEREARMRLDAGVIN